MQVHQSVLSLSGGRHRMDKVHDTLDMSVLLRDQSLLAFSQHSGATLRIFLAQFSLLEDTILRA